MEYGVELSKKWVAEEGIVRQNPGPNNTLYDAHFLKWEPIRIKAMSENLFAEVCRLKPTGGIILGMQLGLLHCHRLAAHLAFAAKKSGYEANELEIIAVNLAAVSPALNITTKKIQSESASVTKKINSQEKSTNDATDIPNQEMSRYMLAELTSAQRALILAYKGKIFDTEGASTTGISFSLPALALKKKIEGGIREDLGFVRAALLDLSAEKYQKLKAAVPGIILEIDSKDNKRHIVIYNKRYESVFKDIVKPQINNEKNIGKSSS